MSDQKKNNLKRELKEAEKLESGLTHLFGSLQPPMGAAQRLQAKLVGGAFHESELTLDDTGPFSFEQAAAAAERDEQGSDLLAAGLEEEPVEDEEENPDRD